MHIKNFDINDDTCIPREKSDFATLTPSCCGSKVDISWAADDGKFRYLTSEYD